MSNPRYTQCKDSGVEWLGEVPRHWKKKRLRYVAKLNPSKSELSGIGRDTDVSFLPMEAIGEDGSLNLEYVRNIADVETGYTYFRDNDVTLAKITPCFENGKGAIMRGLTSGIGFGTTELIVARPIATETTSEYLYWLFNSIPFRKQGESAMYGAGGQKRVPDNFVRDFTVAFPPLSEQQIISTFLDHETVQIDELVMEQKQLITLLKEKRQAVISHAVTKGLDPTVPMKDSSIAWMGKVPEHWVLKRLCHFATFVGGGTPARDKIEFWGGEIPWITPKDMKFEYLVESEETITTLGVTNSSATLINPNQVLIVMRSGILRHTIPIGINLVATTINQDIKAINVSSEMEPAFFMRLVQGLNRELLMEWSKQGATVESLEMTLLSHTFIPIPPRREQSEILHFINSETGKIDALIIEAECAIELLKERRSALISAAVTGKIDVRGLVPEEVMA
jgi:type I restriction enzyme S subunit